MTADKLEQAFRCLGLDARDWDRNARTREDDLKHITSVFRKIAFTHHPDKGGDSETFIEMKLAFEKIRAWYDIDGAKSPFSSPRSGKSPRSHVVNATKVPKTSHGSATRGASSGAPQQERNNMNIPMHQPPSSAKDSSPKSSNCPSPTESERSPRSPFASPTSPKPPTSPRTGMSRAAGGNVGSATRLHATAPLGAEQVYGSGSSKTTRTGGTHSNQRLKTQASQPTISTTSTPLLTKKTDYQHLSQLSAGELKALAKQNGIPTEDLFEKEELVDRLVKAAVKPTTRARSSAPTSKYAKESFGTSGNPTLPKATGVRKTVLDLVSEYLTGDPESSPRANALATMKDYEIDSLMKELREELRTARMEASRRKIEPQNVDQQAKERLLELVTEFLGDLKRVDSVIHLDVNALRKAELYLRQMGHVVKHMSYLDRDLADVLFIPRHLEAFTQCVQNGLVYKRSQVAPRTSSAPLRTTNERTEMGDRRHNNFTSAHNNFTSVHPNTTFF